MLDVALLGTGGMMPLPERYLTSLLCRLNGSLLLIDCGEGTQITLKKLGWGYKQIDCICITHFHADHISGLPGLLLAIGNSNRTEPLLLIGPPGLEIVVRSLCIIAPVLPYELIFHEIDEDNTPVVYKDFQIHTLPVKHKIPCFAYKIVLNRAGRFDVERAKALNVPMCLWSFLQKNETVEYEGKLYESGMVLGKPRPGITVSYCTDSRPIGNLIPFVKNSHLFICEGIYGDDEKLPKAVEYSHMTFSEAALIAKHAGVEELWLTHFSPSLTDPYAYLPVAQSIFENTIVAHDRMHTTIRFPEAD